MTTQTESEWEAEAMRLADRYRRAPLNDVSGYYQDLRAHLATRPHVPDVHALIRAAHWQRASGNTTSWGAGMMVADLEITPNETLTIYAHKDGIAAATGSKA